MNIQRSTIQVTFTTLVLFCLVGSSKAFADPGTYRVNARIERLPGKLDSVLMFNCNSPEIVVKEGILTSTFPGAGKKFPEAHLNKLFKGTFSMFVHHVAKSPGEKDVRTLHLGVVVGNPSTSPVTVRIAQAGSYLSQPDAPFAWQPAMLENPDGLVYSGPGDRLTDQFLRGSEQSGWPKAIKLKAGEERLLFELPVPVRELVPALNGRSTLVDVETNGPVYLASLALFERGRADEARLPGEREWLDVLYNGSLCTPRDREPSPPGTRPIVYGRVAGVQRGRLWTARITDKKSSVLSIPEPTEMRAWPLCSLEAGSFGTGQIQSAPMAVRYPDTAYLANGNYCVEYDLRLQLKNNNKKSRTVDLRLETPVKKDEDEGSLEFFQEESRHVFFRGSVFVHSLDDDGRSKETYWHLVQHRGQRGEPLVRMIMAGGEVRPVRVRFFYPPDATPPQVLTLTTLPP